MVDKKKIPLDEIKKLPPTFFMLLINKAKSYLKKNEVMQRIFKDYDLDISEIDYIPTMFGEIDVSAKTDHGIVILNYRLLEDGDFFKDYSYLVHEYTHWAQQTTGTKPTKGADDGEYLDNPFEQEGFQNQVEYIAEHNGEGEAENYVEELLEHHDIDEDEKEDKKEKLLARL